MSSKQIVVRSATREDGDTWLSLVDALADYEKLARPDADARERLIRDAFGERRRIDVYLAETQGRAAGYAIIFYTYSSFLALPTLYLEDLFVTEKYRGLGVGYHLFKHCVREGIRQGCGRMEWQVLGWNQPAISFYERLGAKQLQEWLPYRVVRSEMQKFMDAANE